MAAERRLKHSRLGRVSQLGRLAGGIAAGMLGEGARQLAKGNRPALSDMLVTPSNARRVGERLAEMRGAAMKVGQLLSMDSGHLLPAELSTMLERLRGDACPMPIGQVGAALKDALGEDWQRHFRRFHFEPIAAASIGQVHRALLRDGTQVALKLQYPGIRASIDSDVDNVATLLRWSRLVPEEIELLPLLQEAKRQLHLEADYRQEAEHLRRFGAHLGDDPRYQIPRVHAHVSAEAVLGMEFLDGDPIETLADAPSAERDRVAADLLQLALREVFEWGLVQTDPNFANYRFDRRSGRIQLLDFGATRAYPVACRDALRDLLRAAVDGSDEDVARAAVAVGYLGQGDPPRYRRGVIQLLRTAVEPAQVDRFHFGDGEIAERMRDAVMALRLEQRYARLPPTGILFLHRKLGGLYLLLSRLKARLPVGELLAPWLDRSAA